MLESTRAIMGIIRLITGMSCLAFASQTLAEVQFPDAGAIMRNQPRPLMNAPTVQPPIAVPKPTAPSAGQSGKLIAKKWNVTGATLIPKAELEAYIAPDLGRELTVQDLWAVAQKVAMYYRERGYLVRAWLPQQKIADGEVEIRVVEGNLEDVNITNPNNVISSETAKKTILAAQPAGQVIRMDDLERGVLLLNDLPGVSAIPTLKQGTKPGTTSLDLNIESRPTINGSLDYANAGINPVGEHQFGGSLFINHPFGMGDQATFRLQGGSGNVYGRITYTMPIGYSGLRVGVAGSGMYYVLSSVAYFEDLSSRDVDGDAWVGGTFASYPLIRRSTTNLYTLAGFDTRRYHNVSNISTLSDKTINVGYVGLQGDHRDSLIGGGFSNFSFYLSAGDLDTKDFKPYYDLDQLTARTQGSYQKFTLAFSRLQKVYGPFSFWSNFVGQLSTKNLDSSEKFSLGGPYGVRAYPVNEALADEGYLMNFELRYDVYNNVQLVGFVDHGGVTLHNNPWLGIDNGLGNFNNSYTLSGGGFGVNWISPGDFAVKLSVAQRIGTNPGASSKGRDVDGTYDTPHFWAQLSKYF